MEEHQRLQSDDKQHAGRTDIRDMIRELLQIAASLPPEMREELLETARDLCDNSEKAAV